MVLVAQVAHASTTTGTAAPASYQHVGSGFTFPLSIGPFQRSTLQQISPDGLHVAAQYDTSAAGHEMSVTVEIYPAPYILPGSRNAHVEAEVCTNHSARFDEEMKEEYRARRVGGGTVAWPSSQSEGSGRRSSFEVKSKRDRGQKVETYLFCPVAKEWMITYIAIAPVENDLTADLARFANWFPWPELAVTPLASERRTTIVVRSTFGEPTYFLRGVILTGSQRDIDIFNAAATSQGLEMHAVTSEPATPQYLTAFDRSTKALPAIDMIRAARDGKMGSLKLDLMLLPLSAANGGDHEDDAIVLAPPDGIDGL
ncbi:hypothetical protein [Rhizorhabdus argentea]|uniref:hypothetical protein n=1 Tax=Rhizorhabdus argentea TaxID=1387174 RepID=UPI0030EB4C1F